MEDDDPFKGFEEEFDRITNEETVEALALLTERWTKISALVSDKTSKTWRKMIEHSFEDIGININALMCFGIKLAVMKNEPPKDYAATFVAGYMLGYMSAKEDMGESVIDSIKEGMPKVDDDVEIEELDATAVSVEIGPTVSDKSSIDDVGAFMRDAANSMTDDFEDADDDWAPVLVAVGEEQTAMLTVPIPDDEQMKTAMFQDVLPLIVRKTIGTPVTVALVVSAWTMAGDKDGPSFDERMIGYDRIRDHPDRKESLFLYLRDDKGESQMWTALILRDDEQPPVLDKWRNISDGDRMKGRIVTMFDRMFS